MCAAVCTYCVGGHSYKVSEIMMIPCKLNSKIFVLLICFKISIGNEFMYSRLINGRIVVGSLLEESEDRFESWEGSSIQSSDYEKPILNGNS